MKHPPAVRFKENTIGLVEFLSDIVREIKQTYKIKIDPEAIDYICIFIKAYDKDALVNNFIYSSLVHWDSIYDRLEEYFTNDLSSIFQFVDVPYKDEYISQLQEVLATKKSNYTVSPNDPNYDPYIVSIEDKNTIWDYLCSFVRISVQFLHQNSGPVMKDGKIEYKAPLYTDIDIGAVAAKWKIELCL